VCTHFGIGMNKDHKLEDVGQRFLRARHHHFHQVEIALRWAVGDQLPGWAYRTRTGESGRGPPDWICVTIRPEVGAIRGGGDPSRASCMMRICSFGPRFRQTILNAKGGQRPEHRVRSGRVIQVSDRRILHSTSVGNGA
jgi:hypothetical protein